MGMTNVHRFSDVTNPPGIHGFASYLDRAFFCLDFFVTSSRLALVLFTSRNFSVPVYPPPILPPKDVVSSIVFLF
jgi:hypothetical protein